MTPEESAILEPRTRVQPRVPAQARSALKPGYKRVPVVNDYCVGCGDCVDVCPEGSLRTILDTANLFRGDTCISCDACIPVCEDDAIRMQWVEMTGRPVVGDWRNTPPAPAASSGLWGWLSRLTG